MSLLYLHDHILSYKKIQSEQTRVKPLTDPLLIPDYIMGLKQALFTHDEVLALHYYYSASNKPVMF
jgi:hypothetical protein